MWKIVRVLLEIVNIYIRTYLYVYNFSSFNKKWGCLFFWDFLTENEKICHIKYNPENFWKQFWTFYFITFFYIHKKRVLDSRKFSTCSFRWIYMFWDVLNTIWPFLENVCPFVCLSVLFCGRCISRTNGRKWMELDIQLHLYGIWSWLNFGVYRSRSSDFIRIFWFL